MPDPIHGDKPHEWMKLANCLGLPAEWFFPERNNGPRYVDLGQKQAKQVCQRCEVRQDCLDYALTPPVERAGIWGGLTAKERGRLRGRRVV